MKKILIVSLLGMLYACSPKAPTEDTASTADKNAASATASSSDDPAAAATSVAQPAKPKWDPRLPLESYTAIKQDKDAEWLTYLAVVHGDNKPSDKDLLEMFSGRYYNERDAFKKQEMIATELPPIKEALAAYAKQRYYSMDFGGSSISNAVSPFFSMVTGYDFDDKSFMLSKNESCLNNAYGNRQQVTLSFVDATPALCRLKMEDLAMAKRVEQLRAANHTSLRGKIYFFVRSVAGGNTVEVVPVHIRYDVFDKPATTDGAQLITSVLASQSGT